jgi:uncharacterized protein
LKNKILNELRGLEEKYEIKIIFAVESGSRAWGCPSEDSDYDVRFIYIHRKDWYLSIDQKRDVIELTINEKLDIFGWELRKTLQLFRKSNPPLMEWLHAGIVYYQAFSLVEKMKTIEKKVFRPQPALYHYVKMAKNNFLRITEKDQVNIKQYINVLRPILACKWIETQRTFPPNEIHQIMDKLLQEGQLKQEILNLVERKMSGDTEVPLSNVKAIKNFMEEEIKRILEIASKFKRPQEDITPMLDQLFRDVLEEVWEQW